MNKGGFFALSALCFICAVGLAFSTAGMSQSQRDASPVTTVFGILVGIGVLAFFGAFFVRGGNTVTYYEQEQPGRQVVYVQPQPVNDSNADFYRQQLEFANNVIASQNALLHDLSGVMQTQANTLDMLARKIGYDKAQKLDHSVKILGARPIIRRDKVPALEFPRGEIYNLSPDEYRYVEASKELPAGN